jgi:hypothetical protein
MVSRDSTPFAGVSETPELATEHATVTTTDAGLFEAIEAALAAGDAVYLIDPLSPQTKDPAELLRNSLRLRGRFPGPAAFLRPADDAQLVRALKRYAHFFICDGCGRDCRDEYYTLRDEVWRAVCGDNLMLCVGCVERRLGRELVPGDFNLEGSVALANALPPSRRLWRRLRLGRFPRRAKKGSEELAGAAPS